MGKREREATVLHKKNSHVFSAIEHRSQLGPRFPFVQGGIKRITGSRTVDWPTPAPQLLITPQLLVRTHNSPGTVNDDGCRSHTRKREVSAEPKNRKTGGYKLEWPLTGAPEEVWVVKVLTTSDNLRFKYGRTGYQTPESQKSGRGQKHNRLYLGRDLRPILRPLFCLSVCTHISLRLEKRLTGWSECDLAAVGPRVFSCYSSSSVPTESPLASSYFIFRNCSIFAKGKNVTIVNVSSHL